MRWCAQSSWNTRVARAKLVASHIRRVTRNPGEPPRRDPRSSRWSRRIENDTCVTREFFVLRISESRDCLSILRCR